MDAQVSISAFIALQPRALWWSWEHPVIEKCLNGAVIATWLPLVQDFIERRNDGTKRLSTWLRGKGRHTLAKWVRCEAPRLLRRGQRNIEWVLTGGSSATDAFLLGLARILDTHVGALRPALAREWLARATVLLPQVFARYEERRPEDKRFRPALGGLIQTTVIDRKLDPECISLQHAERYAEFRLRYPCEAGCETTADDAAMLLRKQSTADGATIVQVAERLQHALGSIDNDLAAQ